MDNDGDLELVVRYMRGNHGHCMRIYELPKDDIYTSKPIRWLGDFAGDSWDSEIKDGYIICNTFDLDAKEKRISQRYKIQKDSAVLVTQSNTLKYILLIVGAGIIVFIFWCFKIKL